MKTKLCRRCSIEKKAKEFYTRETNSDGLSSYCRVCSRMATLDWRRRNPHKRQAHQAVANALKNKVIKRPNKCEKCKKKVYVIAHHENYKKPLEVVWLCDVCHMRLHKPIYNTGHADKIAALNVARKASEIYQNGKILRRGLRKKLLEK